MATRDTLPGGAFEMNPRRPDDENISDFHGDVDRDAASLAQTHSERLQCRRGCSACCVDDLTVWEIEAERIKRHHSALLESASPHPRGACAFLDASGACRIYDVRPYVCRTQGLPLRWFDEHEGETVELRDICPLNEIADSPLESLESDDCWLIGPYEGRLAEMQATRPTVAASRIALRSLFRSDESGDS
jgi:hypothetical protein